ncbi:MAG TPA: hypothetical protein VGN34_27780 [Ktedonobacteraceae bacterium]|jgi:hypothetical protein
MKPFEFERERICARYQYVQETGDYRSIDDKQVFTHLQCFMRSAPQEIQQDILLCYFQQISVEQRIMFARLFPEQYALDPFDPQQMVQGFCLMSQQQPVQLQQLLAQSAMDGTQPVKAAAVSTVVLSEGRFLPCDEASPSRKIEQRMQYERACKGWDEDDDYDYDYRKQKQERDEDHD